MKSSRPLLMERLVWVLHNRSEISLATCPCPLLHNSISAGEGDGDYIRHKMSALPIPQIITHLTPRNLSKSLEVFYCNLTNFFDVIDDRKSLFLRWVSDFLCLTRKGVPMSSSTLARPASLSVHFRLTLVRSTELGYLWCTSMIFIYNCRR